MSKPLQQLINESYPNANDGEGPDNCTMFYHVETGDIYSLNATNPPESWGIVPRVREADVAHTFLCYIGRPIPELAFPEEENQHLPGLQLALEKLESHYIDTTIKK